MSQKINLKKSADSETQSSGAPSILTGVAYLNVCVIVDIRTNAMYLPLRQKGISDS